jgi:hypothetical protein
MEIGKKVGSVVIGYLVIGGLIALTQLGLTKLFEPPCSGTIVHTLWTDFPKRLDDSEVLAGKREDPLAFGLVRGLVQWLPDLYQEVIAGDMTVRDYLLGGYKCVAAKALQFPPGFGLFGSHLEITKGLPRQGSLAAQVLKGHEDAGRATDQTLVTVEPIAGVTLELPGDWLAIDQTAIHRQMTERNQMWGVPEVPQRHVFVPPGQVENVLIDVSSFPPVLPGKELHNLRDPEIRKFVDGMIAGVKEEFENKGFTSVVFTEPSEERVESWTGFGVTVQAISPSGVTLESRHTVIQTPKRTVGLTLANSKASPSQFGETLKHARESLKITS